MINKSVKQIKRTGYVSINNDKKNKTHNPIIMPSIFWF